MKKVISLVFALILLVCLGVPAFASYGDFYAESWEELVEFLDELEDGDEYNIEIAANAYGDVYPQKTTAEIDADNVNLKFGGVEEIWDQSDNGVDGAIFEINGEGVTLDFNGIQMQSNGNPAIVVDGDRCTIKNATFYHCKNKGGKGGGIRITDNDPYCRVEKCFFNGCEAKYGGGIYIDADYATISECTFKDCKSEKEGPDVYDNEGESTVDTCSTNNSEWVNPFADVKEVLKCTFGPSSIASMLSEGNLWIVLAVAVVAVGTVGVLIVRKKKKS